MEDVMGNEGNERRWNIQCSVTYLLIHSFISSFIYSLIHSFICLQFNSLFLPFIHSFVYSFIYSSIYLFIHSSPHRKRRAFCLNWIVCVWASTLRALMRRSSTLMSPRGRCRRRAQQRQMQLQQQIPQPPTLQQRMLRGTLIPASPASGEVCKVARN